MESKVYDIELLSMRFMINNRDKGTNVYFFDSETPEFVERESGCRLSPVSVLGCDDSGLRDRDQEYQNQTEGESCTRTSTASGPTRK